jgi:L-histidine Nalpha-methyltransferase
LTTQTPPRAGDRRPTIVGAPDRHLVEVFAADVRRGLTARPKTLPCRYFYDEVGSQLFERICGLPEYYLTRTEDSILRRYADAMVAGWSRPPALIELGSGSSTKTRRLIAAALGTYGALHYYPIDVSPTILEESAEALAGEFPGLVVTGYAADYRTALAALASRVRGPKLLAFLGSSLGNYEPEDAAGLLADMARALRPGDRLLLGTDLVKGRDALEAAYDDAQGITAQFNRNLLARINRELGADFALERFAHRATYREDLARVEMHLVSHRDQAIRITGAAITVRFAAGESIHTESSHKYTAASLRALADRSGFVEEASWTDDEGLFRVQRWQLRPTGT